MSWARRTRVMALTTTWALTAGAGRELLVQALPRPSARCQTQVIGPVFVLADSDEGPRDRIAMEGRFDLFYQYRNEPGLPRHVFMPFGCWQLVK